MQVSLVTNLGPSLAVREIQKTLCAFSLTGTVTISGKNNSTDKLQKGRRLCTCVRATAFSFSFSHVNLSLSLFDLLTWCIHTQLLHPISSMSRSSSSSSNHFAHYICTGDYPLGANRLLIGIYFEAFSVRRPLLSWGCFIAASFYDRENRVVWHRTVCLVVRTENNTDRRAVAQSSGGHLDIGEFEVAPFLPCCLALHYPRGS